MTPEASSVEPTTPKHPEKRSASQGCDLDEIRAALAAADKMECKVTVRSGPVELYLNAPKWLAAFCTEVERLRELSAQLQVEQDVALAEVERLRADTQELNAGWTECAVERDAALARGAVVMEENELLHSERDAWRACADQLAADLKFTVVQCKTTSPHKVWADGALAEYERLRGQI